MDSTLRGLLGLLLVTGTLTHVSCSIFTPPADSIEQSEPTLSVEEGNV